MTKIIPLVALAAGGTGGHIFPAQALAEKLSKRGYRVAFITDERGMRFQKMPKHTLVHSISFKHFKKNNVLFKLLNLFFVFLGGIKAYFALREMRPVAVVGFGGYPSAVGVLGGLFLRIPTLLHEQNAVLGRTNRYLSSFVKYIVTSFPETKRLKKKHLKKTVFSGMPVRAQILSLLEKEKKIKKDSLTILVTGGSQGASILGNVVPQALNLLSCDAQQKITVYQQVRREAVEETKDIYKALDTKSVVSHFFENMGDLYTKADLVISRSGASSVAEIIYAGCPSILVPYARAMDNHQWENASHLDKSGGAQVVDEKDFTVGWLHKTLEDFLAHPEKLEKMSKEVIKHRYKDATITLCDLLEQKIIKTENEFGVAA